HAQVLSPKSLVAEMAEEIKHMSKHYAAKTKKIKIFSTSSPAIYRPAASKQPPPLDGVTIPVILSSGFGQNGPDQICHTHRIYFTV
ncbi:MAG: hypothetical protein J7L69_13120, partial [Desulfobulbaceae bacterium]|nr:hypothetical protein [Desulfobulbaceae bacterium]